MNKLKMILGILIVINIGLLMFNLVLSKQNLNASQINLQQTQKIKQLQESNDVDSLVGSFNGLVKENLRTEQMFMNTLSNRVNCIHNPTCEGKGKSFEGKDCRFDYYFWKELYEDMQNRRKVCNFESGEWLWQPDSKEGTDVWCNEDDECEEIIFKERK